MMADAIPGTAASAMRLRHSALIEDMKFFSQACEASGQARYPILAFNRTWGTGAIKSDRLGGRGGRVRCGIQQFRASPSSRVERPRGASIEAVSRFRRRAWVRLSDTTAKTAEIHVRLRIEGNAGVAGFCGGGSCGAVARHPLGRVGGRAGAAIRDSGAAAAATARFWRQLR